MSKELIIDCGAYLGNDTQYYLSLGFDVISIDASYEVCNYLENKFTKEINQGKLKIINLVIGEEKEFVKFYESKFPVWSSANINIANRHNLLRREIIIPSKKLSQIVNDINERPYYIKIDIEGNDYLALSSLNDVNKELLPIYISCESECIGDNDTISEIEQLKNLTTLKEIGYNRFKLVDQKTLSYIKLDNYKNLVKPDYAKLFADGSSGILSEYIPCEWLNYDEAKNILLEYRKWFFGFQRYKYEFWIDIHATF